MQGSDWLFLRSGLKLTNDKAAFLKQKIGKKCLIVVNVRRFILLVLYLDSFIRNISLDSVSSSARRSRPRCTE